MTRYSIVLSGMAVAVFLSFGAAAGRAESGGGGAVDPDVAGMDHGKLNHGVLGPEPPRRASSEEAANSGAVDPNVVGMDHSKLNQGVLGPEPPHRPHDKAQASSGAAAPAEGGVDHGKSDHGAVSAEPPGHDHAHAQAKLEAAQPKSGASPSITDERLTAALRDAGRALDSAQIGDTDGVARHSEEAIQQAASSEKATPSEHKRQGIEHLTGAVKEGRRNNLYAAWKHVEEALVHLKEARK